MDAGTPDILLWTPSTLPLERVPERLELGLERFEALHEYAALRTEGAAWLREDPSEDRGRLGRDLLEIEPLLERSVLLDQPNVAGMGVNPWDRGFADVAPGGIDPERRARRMVRGTMLERLMNEEPVEAPAAPRLDPAALGRGADLVEALQRLGQAEAALPPEAPAALRERLARLRRELGGRLRRERAHDAGLDGALGAARLDAPDLAARLRAQASAAVAQEQPDTNGAVARPLRGGSAENPYDAALQQALALPPAPEVDARALAEVRTEARRAVTAALEAPPDSRTSKRLVERARRLFAQEAGLTDGRLATPGGDVDTLALRRQIAGRPGTSPRPAAAGGGLTPAAPEVPVLSGRGPRAKVLGYLAAGETVTPAGEASRGAVPVVVPGSARKGWVFSSMLRSAPTAWPGRLEAPDAIGTAPVPSRPRLEPGAGPVGALAQARGPLRIDDTVVELPDGVEGASGLMTAALGQLPDVLGGRLAADPGLRERLSKAAGSAPELELELTLPTGRAGDPRLLGRVLAEQMADVLVRRESPHVGTLRVKVRPEAQTANPRDAILGLLHAGDADGIARLLAEERRTLDATAQSRLAAFFGQDFADVTVFAGPMSGALARSLQAEAFTHGKLVFFDPQHFRPDTARGEALMAHELAHTRQDAGADARTLEAEALATEAAYLDWLQPGGAPLAKERPDTPADPTKPEAAAATDVKSGFRARGGRQLEETAGPRKDTAEKEARVEQVLRRVTELLRTETDFEEDRIGRLVRHFSGPF